ncbi:hypothetical protein A3L11_03640 [Thermococcus siculi]|uniref:Uncharacterized protein n=1 Tax=Thermococcus siculi TaxID=72803 RepID=A0A2Z2MIV4_9EURY|nr:hypothetical protein [Thermococcus siculi]ASJ08372.1 hypothetical protein A3L11_03640 [Thermococcus siculi]
MFGSGFIARVFSEERLVYALKIVSLALPFWALADVVIAVSRGFGKVREQVFSEYCFIQRCLCSL